MRALVLAALCLVAVLAVVPAPAAAGPVCDSIFEPTIGQNTWRFACGRAECILDGLPNIMVTCL